MEGTPSTLCRVLECAAALRLGQAAPKTSLRDFQKVIFWSHVGQGIPQNKVYDDVICIRGEDLKSDSSPRVDLSVTNCRLTTILCLGGFLLAQIQ